jgi:hypothetical protein
MFSTMPALSITIKDVDKYRQWYACNISPNYSIDGLKNCSSSESNTNYTLTISPIPQNGTVTSPDGKISCGMGNVTSCSATYSKDAAITLTATPQPNFNFNGWSGDCSGTTNSTTTAISANRTCSASFSTTSRSCDANSCTYSNIPINQPGFYIAGVTLAPGAAEGMWGLSVNTTSGINVGGFNAGATLTKNGNTPGFLGFYLSKSEAVKISAFEYTVKVPVMNVLVEKMDDQGNRTAVHNFSGVRQNNAEQPFVEEHSDVLEPGFYIVSAASELGSPSGSFGISVNGDSLVGGVNIGGWLDATTTGFGAFYVASPQQVNLKLLFGNNYSTVGSGSLHVAIDYRSSNGEITPYWDSTSTNTLLVVDETSTPVTTSSTH